MKEKIKSIMASVFPQNKIRNICRVGGMTNLNYKIDLGDIEVVLRIPGEGTDSFISRNSEYENTFFAVKYGYHPNVIYFDQASGVKITEFIKNGITLHQSLATREILSAIADKLAALHSTIDGVSTVFSFSNELEKYVSLLSNQTQIYQNEKYASIARILIKKINSYPVHTVVCHNDLVPENFVKTENEIFLLDWEYAGMNDPCWDIASLFSEWSLSNEDRKFFLEHYLMSSEDSAWWEEKILLYEIAQNILWFIWALVRTQDGTDYEKYAYERLDKANELFIKGKEIYKWF